VEIYLLNTRNGQTYTAIEDEDGIWLLSTDEHPDEGRYVRLGKTWQRAR
jgi:hypothetical protein